MRSDARKRTADHLPHPDPGVREVIARERAAALREAAAELATAAANIDPPYDSEDLGARDALNYAAGLLRGRADLEVRP